MSRLFSVVAVLGMVTACGDDAGSTDAGSVDAAELDAAELDAAEVDAIPIDAPVDAVELDACAPRVLLAGGQDVAAQGWSINQIQPSTLMLGTGETVLTTTTAAGANSGGQLLLSRPGTFALGTPATIEIVLRVDAVSPHNQFDAAAAILAPFTPSVGSPTDRAQMIYLDADRVGWSDNTASFAVAITNGAAHTIRLSYDGAAQLAVAVDGVAALTRTGFTNAGTLAIGDQTNDARVDATMRIERVTLLCP